MAAFVGLILFALAVKMLGAESSTTCVTDENANGHIDGYKILEDDARFRLARTTFATLSSTNFRCVTATTRNKDDSNHQLTEEVWYQTMPDNEWQSFKQRFQFFCGTGGYDRMESIENSTVPPASYQFLWAEDNCTVVTYLDVQDAKKEVPQPQARDSNSEGTKNKLDCMLWVKGESNEPSEACEKQFNHLCNKVTRQSFSTAGCTSPPNRELKQSARADKKLELPQEEDGKDRDN